MLHPALGLGEGEGIPDVVAAAADDVGNEDDEDTGADGADENDGGAVGVEGGGTENPDEPVAIGGLGVTVILRLGGPTGPAGVDAELNVTPDPEVEADEGPADEELDPWIVNCGLMLPAR
jgi:hypothetical protein